MRLNRKMNLKCRKTGRTNIAEAKNACRCRAAQLASIRLMRGQVSRGSAGEYQADERAGVARLSWRVSGR